MASAQPLTNHNAIRRWAEERGAHPARVKGTGRGNDPGMIRLDFPGYSGRDSLEAISWNQWFRQFDDNNLALMVQERTSRGQQSNFNKLIERGSARRGRATTGRRRSGAGGRKRAGGSRRTAGAAGRKRATGRTRATGRKSAAGRKSATGRKSAAGRKSARGSRRTASAAGRRRTGKTASRARRTTSPRRRAAAR